MVVSSLIMVGTSTLSSTKQHGVYKDGANDRSSYTIKKWNHLEFLETFLTELSTASKAQSIEEISPDDDTKESSVNDDDDDDKGPILPATSFSEASADREPQFHRRLKRLVRPSRERERELKWEQAKERHTVVNNNNSGLFLPPFVQNVNRRFEPEVLIFPTPEDEARYSAATKVWQDVGFRHRWDPLGDNSGNNSHSTARLPWEAKVEWLGVLVDAGRHYFPLDWLKRLIVYLHRLRYNMIHFRLTDDQAFAVRLTSYPQLAFPSAASTHTVRWETKATDDETDQDATSTVIGVDGSKKKVNQKYYLDSSKNTNVYTPDELRELVAFAKDHGITMIPEVNLPGHAGSWAGIPDLVLNCPNFACERGYGMPLNIEHPQLKTILTGVIGEVLDIFDNPPLLHLGGDEIFIAAKCFEELEREPFNYTQFETDLKEVLEVLQYPLDQVIRWEETGLPTPEEIKHPKPPRTGQIEHYWLQLPGSKPNKKLRKSHETIFTSYGLYMDTNHNSGAEDIFNRTVEGFEIEFGSKYHPKGIVAGAFELGPDLWMQRNVAGRLIAVAMGAAQLNFTSSQHFWDSYNSTCRDTLGLSASVCDLQGFVAVPKIKYQRDWKQTWNEWTYGICERLTDPSRSLTMARITSNSKTTFEEANKYFWSTLKAPIKNQTRVLHRDLTITKAGASHDSQRSATKTGVIFDLVNSVQPVEKTIELLKKYIAPLGMSLAQLRLADNNGFAIGLQHLSRVSYSPLATHANPMPLAQNFAGLVSTAAGLGIEVFPEISLSTTAGGWVEAGFALNCPQSFCNASSTATRIMANDVGRRTFLPVVYSAIRELMEIFSASRYIHLGSDERESHAVCFHEDGHYNLEDDLPFAAFEKQLTRLLQEYMGVTTQHIIRWENQEHIHYPGRTGDITHYRSTVPFVLPEVRPGEPFFTTLDLLAPPEQSQNGDENPLWFFYEIYKHTRQLMTLKPLGILAEIKSLDDSVWLTHHVGVRLLSFSLGTRPEVQDYSPLEFQEHLVKECYRARLGKCKELTKSATKSSIEIPKESISYAVDSESFVKRVCDLQSVVMVSRKVKSVIR